MRSGRIFAGFGNSRAFRGHRKAFTLAVAALSVCCAPLIGCGGMDEGPAPSVLEASAEGQPAPEVVAHWEALLASSPGTISARWNESGTPHSLYGDISARVGVASEASALRFLSDHAPLFRMNQDLPGLGKGRAVASPMGTHFAFAQEYKGVPVFGAEIKVHFNQDGGIVALNNSYVPDIQLDSVEPSLPSEEAMAIAKSFAPASGVVAADAEESATSELVVYTWRGKAALSFRVLVPSNGPTWEMFIDANTGDVIGEPRDINHYVTGSGQVFVVNAIVATRNNALKDNNDAASAVPSSAYTTVALQGLSGTGYIDGLYASNSGNKNRAFSSTNNFVYLRDTSQFNEVEVYYHLDYAQRYIQSLGFSNVNNRKQAFTVNKSTVDNSSYSPSTKAITYGTGGVDDAEDADVVWHEYGHSIQDNQVPGFGSSAEGGAMGEGFGDYWAGTVGAQLSGGWQDECVAEWDATSYSTTNPPCLRRLDSTKHYPQNVQNEVHADGEMWSAALWQIRGSLGAAKADKLVLQAHFLLSASANFSNGSNALVTAAINLGYTTTEVDNVRTILKNRGFTVTA